MPLPKKLSLSWRARFGGARELEDAVQVFHRWISRRALDEVLIDVADYRHVKNTPAVVLVGLGHNYGLRLCDDGGLEFYCDEKRREGSDVNPLTRLFGTTVRVCRLLEEDLGAPGLIEPSQVVISTRDRLFPKSECEEFSWHVRQALAPAIWTVPTVSVRPEHSLPTVQANWIAERSLKMIDETYSDRVAQEEELRA